MNILAINCGSSSLKFRLLRLNEADAAPRGGQLGVSPKPFMTPASPPRDEKGRSPPGSAGVSPARAGWKPALPSGGRVHFQSNPLFSPGWGGVERLAEGSVDRIGGSGSIDFQSHTGQTLRQIAEIPDHEAATRRALDWLAENVLKDGTGLDAAGHRIVHGGTNFSEPVLIDAAVARDIEALEDLAPLHNGPALRAIRAAREALGPDVPMVATFDTAFHQTMPDRAAQYALPWDLAQRHGIRRFGFHGLAHRSLVERYAALTATPVERLRLITLQLGGGCSAAAIDGGRSIDTTMGFTPLEGLMMGTRSGDLDPALPAFIAEHEATDDKTVEGWLNSNSGLLGVSGRSADIRDLRTAADAGDARAELAIDMFCYRVRKAIGAYLAVLGGADAIVFGGGIGEHDSAARARICAGMEWCGLTLDAERNRRATGAEARISADDASIACYVIPTDEESVIARDTARCLRAQP